MASQGISNFVISVLLWPKKSYWHKDVRITKNWPNPHHELLTSVLRWRRRAGTVEDNCSTLFFVTITLESHTTSKSRGVHFARPDKVRTAPVK